MFATGDSRCPDAHFKNILSKRPENLKLADPFYLACIENPTKTDVWYKKSRMGKNTISKIMQSMKENSPLQEMCPDKKIIQPLSPVNGGQEAESQGSSKI